VDGDPTSKMKNVTRSRFLIRVELNSEVTGREDVEGWGSLILDDEGSLVGLGKDSCEIAKVSEDGLVWSSEGKFHSGLLLDSGEVVLGNVEVRLADGLLESVRDHVLK